MLGKAGPPPTLFLKNCNCLSVFFGAPFLNNPVNSYVMKQILLSFRQILGILCFREGVEKNPIESVIMIIPCQLTFLSKTRLTDKTSGRSKIFRATNLERGRLKIRY